jgi:predicted transcriptional regulator of viral defense system
MMRMTTVEEAGRGAKLPTFLRGAGVFRPRDYAGRLHRSRLRRLVDAGLVERAGRGLYRLADADATELHSLALAAKRVPHGVVCLLSALAFHGMGTQLPHRTWLAVDRRARSPASTDGPPLRLVRLSGPTLTEGVVEHVVEGVPVRVTSPARTVADCFKFRNKVGVDVAIEALRDFRRLRLGTNDDLWRYATLDRVTAVMRPYMEAIP